MAYYMEISAPKSISIYLRYVAPEDIHVYSIDEVFIDATNYLHAVRPDRPGASPASSWLRCSAGQQASPLRRAMGTNLFLCKVAMDIGAKHIPAG